VTVTHNQPAKSQPSGRTLAIGVAVTIGVIAAVVLIFVLANSGSDNGDAETAYLDEVSTQLDAHRGVDLADADRQPFIDAGYELCDAKDPDTAAADSRAILEKHGLGEYAGQWVFISAAAADHLC
jgi:hypothetical protein